MRQKSGFGWDDSKGIPTASSEIWRTYLKVSYYLNLLNMLFELGKLVLG